MVNFDKLVQNILLNEANIVGVPQWFQGVINKHKEIFNIDITDEDIFDFFELLDDAKISETEGLKNYNKIRILDFMKVFYDTMNPKPKDVNEFKSLLTNNTNFANLPIVKRILSLNPTIKDQWELNNKNIIDLKIRAEKTAGQKGADTLQSEYGNDFIIPAVQKIVKKRIDFFTRIAKLKSPTTPFVNLINDVFKNPEQFESGAKKFTSDFEAVDKFYIDNLIEIAKAAKQFYATELTNLKLAPTQLENFVLWVNNILNEAPIPSSYEAALTRSSKTPAKPTPTPKPVTVVDKNQILKNIAANKKAIQSSNFGNKQVSPQLIKDTKQKELQDVDNRILYLSGKPIKYKKFKIINPNKIQETDKEVTITPLTISQILQLKTPESNALSQALGKVAEYSKSRTGAGERLQQLGQMGSSIAAAAGAKLYA